MGSTDEEDAPLRTISKNAGVVIVSVDYRLAPKYPYPAGLEDCLETYKWALANTSSLNTTPNQVVLFGTSAGANLALCTALKLIDSDEAGSLKGVVAIVPPTVVPEAVPETLKAKYTSYTECSEKTINTKEGMKAFTGTICPLHRKYQKRKLTRKRCIRRRSQESVYFSFAT